MKIWKIAVSAAFGMLFVGAANAVTLDADEDQGGGGNYCADIDDCVLDESPAILKFDWVKDSEGVGSFVATEFSYLFPSITGTEFSFSDIVLDEDNDPLSASFSYTPEGFDPLLTGIVVKGSNDNDGGAPLILSFDGTTYFGSFDNTGLPDAGGSGKPPAISNITFFDTEAVSPIPLPAAGWLLLAGVGGLAAYGRKKRWA